MKCADVSSAAVRLAPRHFTWRVRGDFYLHSMGNERMPTLPLGYSWSAYELVDGRKVVEVRLEVRHLVAYAFQPKRRRGWYISGDGLAFLSSSEGMRSQCWTVSEAYQQLAERAREHKRSYDEMRGDTR